MKKRHFAVLLVCALFGGYALVAFQESVTPYVSIAEARQERGSVQVKGTPDRARPAAYGADGAFRFYLTDDAGASAEVVYRGVKPDGFDDAVHIVAVGRYEGGAIQAERLLLKCPSKYEGRRPQP